MSDAEIEPGALPLREGERPPVPGAFKTQVVDDGAGRHHTARTKARKAALDFLYDADVTGRDPLDLLDGGTAEVRPLTRDLVAGVVADVRAIDRRLQQALSGEWSLARMPAIDRGLARLATWELLHTETPPAAVIAEAVGLADEYSTEGSAAFLSSLLGTVAGRLDPSREPAAEPASWLDTTDAPSAEDMAAYVHDVPNAMNADQK